MINIRLLVKEANEGKVFEEKSKNRLLAGMLRGKILPHYMKYEVKTNITFKEVIEEEIEFVTNVEEPWKAEVLDMLNFLLDKVNKNIEIEMNEDQTFEFIKNYSNEHPDLLISEIRDKFKEDERFHPLTLHRVIRKFKWKMNKIVVNTIFLDRTDYFAEILKERIQNFDIYSFQVFRTNGQESMSEFESEEYQTLDECKNELFKYLNGHIE